MHTRLLSFLSDFHNALLADDPAPADGGSWACGRMVNYQLGLARMTLAVNLPTGGREDRGTVMLQSYALADGTPCLKAVLGWIGREKNQDRSIYARPDVDWRREARQIAAEWMAGPPAPAADSGNYQTAGAAAASSLAI
ncbi:MAG: hypothetical protein PSV13_01710 [Lacunisphaera sp.]|nr:hypothetical protein [Lacunisphaera sp.]